MPLSGPLSNSLTCDFNGACGGTPTPPASTLNDGLISYYDSDGTDRVGSNNLTPKNTPGTAVGKISPLCIHLTKASSQYYDLPDVDAADFEPDQNIAYACWAKADSGGIYGSLFGKSNVLDGKARANTSNAIEVFWGSRYVTTPAAAIVPGTWFFTYVQFLMPDALSMSVNDGTVYSHVAGAPQPATALPFNLGATGNSTGANSFDGSIDQFCMWHRALTPAEITELYNGGSGTDFLAP